MARNLITSSHFRTKCGPHRGGLRIKPAICVCRSPSREAEPRRTPTPWRKSSGREPVAAPSACSAREPWRLPLTARRRSSMSSRWCCSATRASARRASFCASSRGTSMSDSSPRSARSSSRSASRRRKGTRPRSRFGILRARSASERWRRCIIATRPRRLCASTSPMRGARAPLDGRETELTAGVWGGRWEASARRAGGM